MSPDRKAPDSSRPPEHLKDLLGALPLATVVLGETGVIVFSNELLTELLGWEAEEILGKKFENFLPERLRSAYERLFVEYLLTPAPRALDTVEARWVCRKDGKELPVDIALNFLAQDGATFVVAALHDLSERHRVEQEFRDREQRFRIAAGHAVDVIQEVDLLDDRMTYFGDVDAHFGYEPGEFPRTLSGLADFVHPDDLAALDAGIAETVEGGRKDWLLRYRVRAADGSYRHLVDQGTFVGFLDDGQPNRGVGAFRDITDQVVRELELEEGQRELRRALAEVASLKDRLEEENVYLRRELGTGIFRRDIIGDCETWRHVLSQVQLVASTNSTVLISGETGTGKEMLAQLLLSESQRRDRPLIKVNCAALPSTLIESELFGHEKGAYSGADRQRKGRFELADKGTLLLDEIGELPLELQVKLLHVLQTGEFERVGSSRTLQADVRVIASTNRDLPGEVEAGRFRSDLYYRLAVFPIEAPPLRRRRSDIPLLAMYFLGQQNLRHGKSIRAIPRSVMAALQAYDWPGNVRELENLIERAVILSAGSTLRFDPATLDVAPVLRSQDSGLPATVAPTGRTGRTVSNSLESVERAHILAVLESCAWKVKGRGNAAEQLGLNESTLRSRMRRLGITRP